MIRSITLASAVLLVSASALARNPVVLKLTDGNNAGPTGQNTGPGAEQATVVQTLQPDGRRIITTVWMSSQVSEADGPYQCKCAAVELDPLTGPRTVAGPVQLTNNDGNRPCNHPHMDVNPVTNQILWSYGTNDPNQNNVQPYVQGLDAMCNITTERVRIGNNNGNDGAPWTKVVNPEAGLFQVGYLENNERSRAVGITFAADNTITELYNEVIVDPANIGRPSVERFSDTRTLFCSSNGDNRPPEIGVRCAMVNAINGDIIWSQVMAQSQPNASPPIYMNQPVVALGENGRFYLQVEQSGGNNGGNSRGATQTRLHTFLPDEAGPHPVSVATGLGLNQVHATTCTGKFGAEGALHVAIVDASITGSGFAAAQMAKFDITGQTLLPVGGAQVLGAYPGDGGYLANLYGQNPNTQGREFMRCIGDIPNPGFGVTNGFLPTVKSFFAMPFAGNVPGEEKNSLFLSVLPAEEPTPAPIVTHDLVVSLQGDGEGSVSSNPLGIDGCGDGGGDGTGGGGGGGTGGGGGGGANCTATFDEGLRVTLTAVPEAGSSFGGWGGDCSGTGSCVVDINAARNVTATFILGEVPVQPGDPVGLIVNIAGDGGGVVTSSPAGIECATGTCAANFTRGDTVTLTAEPKEGSVFVGWIGECSGTGNCVITLNGARSVTATFNLDPEAPPPVVTPPPVGGGPVGGGAGCACSAQDDNSAAPIAAIVMGMLLLVRLRRRSLQAIGSLTLVGLVTTAAACELKLGPATQPTVNVFSAVSPAIAVGAPAELAYDVTGAETVTVSLAGGADILTNSTLLSGSIFTPPLTNSSTFILIAVNQDLVTTATVNVIVGAGAPGTPVDPNNPTVPVGETTHASIASFTPSSSSITTGDSATLTWSTSNAASGVILANDAILQTINGSDVASGSVTVNPTASTVYTLSVTGTDGQAVTMTTAVNVGAAGEPAAGARAIFDTEVQGMLETRCGACHESNNPSGYPDMFGPSSDTYYDRLVADGRYVTAVPEDSLLLIKGEHTGPAFQPAQAQKVTAWLVAEAEERNLEPPPAGTPGDFAPRTLAEALTRFGACMSRADWDATYGAGNNTQLARQNSTEGQCLACHSSGTAGAFLSASSGDTFEMNRLRPNILKLVLSTSNPDGSFKDLVPARRFELKGGEAGDPPHPSYILTPERLTAIDTFVDLTLTRFRDYSQQCNAVP